MNPRAYATGRLWLLAIPGWRPALANELRGHPMQASRLKRRDREVVWAEMRSQRIPAATGRRAVRITITGPFRRLPDPDSPLKSTLDALKQAGLIVDDSAEWCLWSTPVFDRGPLGTVIELEAM